MILVFSCLFCCNYYVIAFNISNSGHHFVPSMRNSPVEVHALAIFEIDLPSSRVRKIKGMQRRISSLWATGTAKFQVAWLYISTRYCNRRNFHTRFDFAYFVLLAESTKVRNFSRIWKPCMYTSECDTALTERKFIAYKSSRTKFLQVRNFFAITVVDCRQCSVVDCWLMTEVEHAKPESTLI